MTNVEEKKGYMQTIYEGEEGRNLGFKNLETNKTLTRAQFVTEIEQGMHPLYHIAEINEVKTPKSNPGVLPNLD